MGLFTKLKNIIKNITLKNSVVSYPECDYKKHMKECPYFLRTPSSSKECMFYETSLCVLDKEER